MLFQALYTHIHAFINTLKVFFFFIIFLHFIILPFILAVQRYMFYMKKKGRVVVIFKLKQLAKNSDYINSYSVLEFPVSLYLSYPIHIRIKII